MDISEKILKFAENQKTIDEKLHGDFSAQYDNGYNTGYSKGKTDGYSDGYNIGIVDGAASVPNPFEYATKPTNVYLSSPFPDGSEFEINLPIVTDISGLFWATKGLKKITVKGNIAGNLVMIDNAFRELPSVETVDLSEFNCKAQRAHQVFYNSQKLKNILGVLDFSEAVGHGKPFDYCTALEEVRFKANSIKLSISFAHSSKLSAESVQSIIDGLATVETAQTLTLHATVSAMLTDDQMSQILAKNWSVA